MKNLKIIVLAAVCLLSVNACKKEAAGSGSTGGTALLETVTSFSTNIGVTDTTYTTYTYDNQNRVISVYTANSMGPSGGTTLLYTYYTDSVVMLDSNLNFTITYYLNSAGYRTSDNLGNTWAYNSAGYQISAITAIGDTTINTYNALNQLATQVVISAGTTTTNTYTYPANPVTLAGITWQTGKSTGALWTKDLVVQTGLINATSTLSGSYLTNSQKMVSEEVVTSSASGVAPVATFYTYY